MNYWLTTQWPSLEDEEADETSGIYLPNGRQEAGLDIQPGDMVFIYQSKTGRIVVREDVHGEKHYYNRLSGKEGIISVAKITSLLLKDDDSDPTTYSDGTEIWWCWYAMATPLSNNGFVSRTEVNRTLGYKDNYRLRGFGDRKSGLKKLTQGQFDRLLELFNRKTRNIADTKKKLSTHSVGSGGGGESEGHKFLKKYVAANPAKVLGEQDLSHLFTEFNFPTQDRADIVLLDRFGKIIGVEVEVSVDQYQLEGILQAVKYRHMLAILLEYPFEHSRSFLVAYKISSAAKKFCNQYGVECFTVPEKEVNNWIKEHTIMD